MVVRARGTFMRPKFFITISFRMQTKTLTSNGPGTPVIEKETIEDKTIRWDVYQELLKYHDFIGKPRGKVETSGPITTKAGAV